MTIFVTFRVLALTVSLKLREMVPSLRSKSKYIKCGLDESSVKFSA